jgi:hypothetical protein
MALYIRNIICKERLFFFFAAGSLCQHHDLLSYVLTVFSSITSKYNSVWNIKKKHLSCVHFMIVDVLLFGLNLLALCFVFLFLIKKMKFITIY